MNLQRLRPALKPDVSGKEEVVWDDGESGFFIEHRQIINKKKKQVLITRKQKKRRVAIV